MYILESISINIQHYEKDSFISRIDYNDRV